jgi:hypothetical protein
MGGEGHEVVTCSGRAEIVPGNGCRGGECKLSRAGRCSCRAVHLFLRLSRETKWHRNRVGKNISNKFLLTYVFKRDSRLSFRV